MCLLGVWLLGRSLCDLLGQRGRDPGPCREAERVLPRSCSCIASLALVPSSFGDLRQVDFDLLIRALVSSSVTRE